MTVRISVEETFHRALKSLPPDRQRGAALALKKFMAEPGLPSLRFRQLSGRPFHYIINPHRGDRIILRKDANDLFAAVDVGPHDNIYRRWDR